MIDMVKDDLTDVQKKNSIEFHESRINILKREISGHELEIIRLQESME